MKLTLLSAALIAVTFGVFAFLFHHTALRFDTGQAPRRVSAVAKSVPPIVHREGPTRDAWSADLRRRERALEASESKLKARLAANEDPESTEDNDRAPIFVTINKNEAAEPVLDDVAVHTLPLADSERYPAELVSPKWLPQPEPRHPLVPFPVVPADGLVPLKTEIPQAWFEGIPNPIKVDNLEPIERKQKPLLVPQGTILLSDNKPVTASDDLPVIGNLEYLTDGDKNAADGSYIELGPQKQWVQIDLEETGQIFGIWIWHFHKRPRVYLDVIVQVSNDINFVNETATIYNNDHDNSSGLGAGADKAYYETNLGRVVNARGLYARYVRLYSNGNTSNEMNHYIEVEVWGQKPIP